jgi:CRP-like cAMP-binding protein
VAFSKKLCIQLPSVKLPAKHVLFRQGEAADAVFYIVSGRVHRMIATEKGNERLVAILGPEDFCGEECLTVRRLHTTSALVTEAAEIIRIDRMTMSRLLHEAPAVAEIFTAFLLSRHLKTEAALIDQLVGSVEQRLRHLLATLANMEVNGSRTGVITNTKQEMLAALVGTTRPRVNHFLNKFRKLGLIEFGGALPRGEIRIRSIARMCNGTGQS